MWGNKKLSNTNTIPILCRLTLVVSINPDMCLQKCAGFLLCWLVFFFVFLADSHAFQTNQTVWQQARKLIKEGKSKQALVLLEPREADDGGLIEYDLLLATALMAEKRWVRARFTLARILILQPEHSEALQGLVRIDAEQGRLTPGEISPGVELQGYLQTTLGFDSNVSEGPDVNYMSFPATGSSTLYNLGDLTRESDFYFFIGGTGTLTKKVTPNWLLSANLEAGRKIQQQRDDLREGTTTLRLGISPGNTERNISLNLLGNNLRFGGESYRNTLGVALDGNRKIGSKQRFTVAVQGLRHYYPDNTAYDSNYLQVNTKYRYLWKRIRTGRASINLLLGWEKPEHAESDYLGYDLKGIETNLSLELSKNLILFAQVDFQHRSYDGSLPFYSNPQRDSQWQGVTSLAREINKDWWLFVSLSHTDNHSNLEYYNYDRTVLAITARWYFN